MVKSRNAFTFEKCTFEFPEAGLCFSLTNRIAVCFPVGIARPPTPSPTTTRRLRHSSAHGSQLVAMRRLAPNPGRIRRYLCVS